MPLWWKIRKAFENLYEFCKRRCGLLIQVWLSARKKSGFFGLVGLVFFYGHLACSLLPYLTKEVDNNEFLDIIF